MKGKKVLVVEDNEINMEIMSDMLDSMGIEMEGAENGQEAVNKLQNASIGDFDVVLMDIHMPVMNGYEATKAIRLSQMPLKEISILAMTGDNLSEDRERAREAGMNGLLTKPVSKEQILQAIEGVL